MKISAKLCALKYKISYNALILLNRNNPRTKAYKEEGLRFLQDRVELLPKDIAFKPKFTPKSTCVKAFDKFYIFISKINLSKPKAERYDSLFHEIGHWLHFQQLPASKERNRIWGSVNLKKIGEDVSKRAVYNEKEFVAEVFKYLVKGKKFDSYIMNLYRSLNGPALK